MTDDATPQSDETTPDVPADPVRPVKEYEEITIRILAIGFTSGVQDMTLYPEDTMEVDGNGNIRLTFPSLGGGEFVAYAGHTEFHSIKEVPHKREKGALRPSPEQLMREFEEQKKRKKIEQMKEILERAALEE